MDKLYDCVSHSRSVLPFNISLNDSAPIAEQVIFAVKRAVVTGQLKEGDKFPSVRALSQDLRINPTTAHRVMVALVEEGVLESIPAVGTVVARKGAVNEDRRANLLGPEMERLCVEARRLGLSAEEVRTSFETQWKKLNTKGQQ